MVQKASKKIWLLRRMKKLGVDEITMTSYCSILEERRTLSLGWVQR